MKRCGKPQDISALMHSRKHIVLYQKRNYRNNYMYNHDKR
jgi:hypothetical protein